MMIKRLACLEELRESAFMKCMDDINRTARKGDLMEYTTYSRLWEYPWIWLHLRSLKNKKLRILDIGSEISPFIWFLANRGFDVTISDITAKYWGIWSRSMKQLGVQVKRRILDSQDLDLPTAGVDVYLSVSVIEHVPRKAESIEEAARVLKPGGMLILTFDICEPDMGMTFPEWNGQALTMAEFDGLFRDSPWFEPGLSELPWNTEDIPDYLAWNRTTAPHHNYVTGAAVLQRNDRKWVEPKGKNLSRILRGKIRTDSIVGMWYLRQSFMIIRSRIPRPIRVLKRILRAFTA